MEKERQVLSNTLQRILSQFDIEEFISDRIRNYTVIVIFTDLQCSFWSRVRYSLRITVFA